MLRQTPGLSDSVVKKKESKERCFFFLSGEEVVEKAFKGAFPQFSLKTRSAFDS